MNRRWLAMVAVGVLIATSSGKLPGFEGSQTGEKDQELAYNARHEAAFEKKNGKEAKRGPDNPVAELVENRAYPRSYVDDRRAQSSRRAFDAKPRALGPSSYSSASAFAAAQAAAPGAWQALGPVTPNVTGIASQFFNPATLNGPGTQESGRVTALAIDPNCGTASAPAGAPCRLWVAAAGGGIWWTKDALATTPAWNAPPVDLATNAFGSLIVDPNDATGSTLYAGSGEPNGSGDSEAGLGLYKTTDGGVTWSVIAGSVPASINRSIGAIAVVPGNASIIYIGTDVARHGSSAANGGRRTPPDAPALGVYKSTDGGAHFAISTDLQSKTPANPTPASTGSDWFQGGINKLQLDPHDANTVYAGVVGYGVWRSGNGASTWSQVFHTLNQTNFNDPNNPGDFFGDRTEFDAVPVGTKTRIYVGDSSDDLGEARVWRTDDAAAVTGDPNGAFDNAGWTELSSSANGTNGFLAFYYCQNGQCGYDDFVVSPPGHPDSLWLGGSMNYDELAAYDQFGSGAPPRSNGRAVVRSTNAGATAADVTWQDMTAVLGDPTKAWDVKVGQHPDLHAIVFANNGNVAFVGSDGGVVRVDVTTTQDQSASCDARKWNYDAAHPKAAPIPLKPEDLLDCKRLLSAVPSAITPVNDGLNTIQFQSLSANPNNPTGELLGGTQDNGTWWYTGSPTWLESIGGDGGQSGFDAGNPTIRYHNYYDATPEVNFHGSDPKTWVTIYDPLQSTGENRSFYVPFITDPSAGGRAFVGLAHVWRTNDSGGNEQQLIKNGCLSLKLNPFRRKPCGDWVPIGDDLTSGAFGKDRAGQYVVATTRAPSDTGTMWAATRIGRVFITSNADEANPSRVKFFRLDSASTPGRFVSGIAVDPGDPNHAWISYSGYGAYTPSTPGHVFDVRVDPATHRATFTDISYDIGDQPVTGIAQFSPTGDLYAATDFGVLRLPHGATNWEQAGTGLPHAAVYGLTLSIAGKVLYAATHGRGAWSLTLPT